MSANSELFKITLIRKIYSKYLFINIVKSGKFGNSQLYLKQNPNQEAVLSFKLIENKTKKIKEEKISSPFSLKEKIILLKDEKIVM